MTPARVAELIEKKGRPVTIRTAATTGAPYDPVVETTDSTAYAVVSSAQSKFGNALVQAGDLEIMTFATLASGNKVIDGETVYTVVSVEEIKPGTIRFGCMAIVRRN